jgi:hypothetical protein
MEGTHMKPTDSAEQRKPVRQARVALYRARKFNESIALQMADCQLTGQLSGNEKLKFPTSLRFQGLVYKSDANLDRAEKCYDYAIDPLRRIWSDELATQLSNAGIHDEQWGGLELVKQFYERGFASLQMHFSEDISEDANRISNMDVLREVTGSEGKALLLHFVAYGITRTR